MIEQPNYSGAYGVLRLIKDRRAELNLHQLDVAKSIGVSQAVYSRIESGIAALSVERFFLIAEKLGLEISVFRCSS